MFSGEKRIGCKQRRQFWFRAGDGTLGNCAKWALRQIWNEKRPSLKVNAPCDWLWKSLGRIVG
jgi:hypothetical protein